MGCHLILALLVLIIVIEKIIKSSVHLNELDLTFIAKCEAFHVDILDDTFLKVLVNLNTILVLYAVYLSVSQIMD